MSESDTDQPVGDEAMDFDLDPTQGGAESDTAHWQQIGDWLDAQLPEWLLGTAANLGLKTGI